MGTQHIVEQGEYLAKIATDHGFTDFKSLWDHPENAELKKKRKNPNILFPGDRVFIPAKEPKEESKATDQRHRFEVKIQKVKLRLVLENIYEEPIANAECELNIEGETVKLTTDGKGKIEQEISAVAQNATLSAKDPKNPVNLIIIPIKIGHLDPVEEPSGQKARLNNLGYAAGPQEGQDDRLNEEAFLSAIEEFQCEHGLTVDGICGPATQAKLKKVHGC
ncbi:MAG: peptidoglycan-binding protein [Acidobacteriota bacterium]